MGHSRNEIKNLIERLNQDFSLVDRIKHSEFESVTAELLARNRAVFDVTRNAIESLDYVGKFKNQLGIIDSFAVEAKRISGLVDENMVAQLAKAASDYGINKSYMVTTSKFSEAAKAIAAANRAQIELIDRSSIARMLDQYKKDQELFASTLFDRFGDLNLEPLFEVQNPEPTDIEELDLDETPLQEDQKFSLIQVDRLPLKLLTAILRNPGEVRNITPRQFEEFIADVLSQLGFQNVILTPRSGDGGKDIIASNSINNIPLSFYFECKKYAEGNKVQLQSLRALLGTMAHDSRLVNKGVLVTTSTFTRGCNEFIVSESRLDGKDYDGILGWIDELKKQI